MSLTVSLVFLNPIFETGWRCDILSTNAHSVHQGTCSELPRILHLKTLLRHVTRWWLLLYTRKSEIKWNSFFNYSFSVTTINIFLCQALSVISTLHLYNPALFKCRTLLPNVGYGLTNPSIFGSAWLIHESKWDDNMKQIVLELDLNQIPLIWFINFMKKNFNTSHYSQSTSKIA